MEPRSSLMPGIGWQRGLESAQDKRRGILVVIEPERLPQRRWRRGRIALNFLTVHLNVQQAAAHPMPRPRGKTKPDLLRQPHAYFPESHGRRTRISEVSSWCLSNPSLHPEEAHPCHGNQCCRNKKVNKRQPSVLREKSLEQIARGNPGGGQRDNGRAQSAGCWGGAPAGAKQGRHNGLSQNLGLTHFS